MKNFSSGWNVCHVNNNLFLLTLTQAEISVQAEILRVIGTLEILKQKPKSRQVEHFIVYVVVNFWFQLNFNFN